MSDHFPIVFAIKTDETTQTPVVKSTYCQKNIDKFKNTLHNWNWYDIKKIEDPNKPYKYFLVIFIDIYDNSFLQSKVKVKFTSDQSPWITKSITKSSKKKQRLYEKFLKIRTPSMKRHIKLIKTYLKPLKEIKEKIERWCEKNMECYERDTWKVHHKILNYSN